MTATDKFEGFGGEFQRVLKVQKIDQILYKFSKTKITKSGHSAFKAVEMDSKKQEVKKKGEMKSYHESEKSKKSIASMALPASGESNNKTTAAQQKVSFQEEEGRV